ncbi:DNA replication/repair protein RecF [Leptospira sp. GIMC2001]|uniref:DNA replication/repair protein RecF n=1 Tax=Leptospira sp. GIMC2001 TaxID=1513297 RepID=UPI002349BE52|nr:DNA replication/repair protein RecF [Leptospira sp. GIMC2001]WCL49523.1 DNA replication/repair protein RecF [Leptospira sp. GIMC2001]
MILKRLSLNNFRTYRELNLEFKSRLIFFIGDNGEGKSNLLESISILSFLKSFRGNSDDEILSWGENTFYIGSKLFENEEESRLEYGFEKNPIRRKKIKFNNNLIKKQSEAYGILPCVVLSPKDLDIVEGGSSERRKFIDGLISALDKNYLNTLLEYNRILKQRNTSLKKQITSAESLGIWDKMLCEKDNYIRNARANFIKDMDILFRNNLNLLSGSKDDYGLFYKPNAKSTEDYEMRMRDNFQKDLRVGYTTVGCHRDEITIGGEDKDVLSFGSQGQRRSVVISLKTASFELLRRKIGIDPILLIDDVIRELDTRRREFFVDLIRGCGQAFFTTTDLEGIHDYIGNLDEPRQIFQVTKGSVTEL